MSRSIRGTCPSVFALDHAHISPHVKLWANVLRRGAFDWSLYFRPDEVDVVPGEESGDPTKGEIGQEAHDWIFGDPDDINSDFALVCSYQGLDPDVVRGRIRDLTEDSVRRKRGMEFRES